MLYILYALPRLGVGPLKRPTKLRISGFGAISPVSILYLLFYAFIYRSTYKHLYTCT
jgi:hypothetical protein